MIACFTRVLFVFCSQILIRNAHNETSAHSSILSIIFTNMILFLIILQIICMISVAFVVVLQTSSWCHRSIRRSTWNTNMPCVQMTDRHRLRQNKTTTKMFLVQFGVAPARKINNARTQK